MSTATAQARFAEAGLAATRICTNWPSPHTRPTWEPTRGLIRLRRHATSGGTIERTMYGIAYVIIPTEFESLQAALDEALAPFRRGGLDEFPREALAFDDVTGELRQLHRLPITLEAKGAGVVLQSNDSASADDFDFAALAEFLAATGAPSWSGRFRRRRTGPRRLRAPLHAMEGARRSSRRLRPLAQPARPLGLVGTRRSLRRPRQRTAAAWRRRGTR